MTLLTEPRTSLAPALTPVTAATSAFTFYDIESLSNVFTLCAYTPAIADGQRGTLEVFYLIDRAPDGTNLADSIDHNHLGQLIFSSNPALPPHPFGTLVRFFDLRHLDANLRLAQVIGLSDAEHVGHRRDRSSLPANLRPVCDTDAEYDPVRHPFLAGYNSLNYDTVMLGLYFMELCLAETEQLDPRTFTPNSASALRQHNDQLFSDQHIEYMPGYLGWDSPQAVLRRNMINSGRHLDVARLNELQFKVSLKRLLGMLGRQIKESDKLSNDTEITTLEEFYELIAYNVSDCLGLSQLFRHSTYAGNFDLKAGLLAQYSETVFAKNGSIRRDRLTIDASSAKFVGRILAPYDPLDDIEAVSYLYPEKAVALEHGIAQVNVLDECVKFFEQEVAANPATTPGATPAQREAHAQFMQVVDYYRSIEGKNFNDSENYTDRFDQPTHLLRAIPKTPNNLPYFQADATPSSCFVTFSYGGIHGAEADIDRYDRERVEHRIHAALIERAKLLFPDARDFVAEAKRQHNLLTLPDGTTVDKRIVLLGSDPAKVKYRGAKKGDDERNEAIARATSQVPDTATLLATQRDANQELDVVVAGDILLPGKIVLATTSASKASYRDEPARRAPMLFVEKKGDPLDRSTKLHANYARTSAGLVVHEDFTSYYPNLLRNMRAFYNPELGEDRYASIFFDKERYGRELKQSGLSPDEKARLNTLRNGTKLILNSASGAGDAAHKTPIRMNNRIISMRILGQLFSWRIGQAQTLAGARIISTNTDGLYSVVNGSDGFDEARNNQVLAQQQAAINIDIEPELMFLISKDSNNRLELHASQGGPSLVDAKIIAAGGGTLACHAGPTPTKSLAHAAVLDFALARYLKVIASRGEPAFAEAYDPALGREMIEAAVDLLDPVHTLLLFQNVIAASRGSITYPFAADAITDEAAWVETEIVPSMHDLGATESVETRLELDSSFVRNPRALQMVNRVFVVKSDTPGAVNLHNAGAWKVTQAMRTKRQAEGTETVRTDPVATQILRSHGWTRSLLAPGDKGLNHLPHDQDVVVRKISGIDSSWPMVVLNDDLHMLSSAATTELIAALDLAVYAQMLGEVYTKSWMNAG